MGETGKLFIGNLPYSVGDNELRDLFQDFGNIDDCIVITDRETRRSKGFGFVTFSDQQSADKAINEMAGHDVEGRQLNVKPANPRNSGGGGGGYRGGRNDGGYGGGYGGGNRGYNNDRGYDNRGGYQDRGDRYGNQGGGYHGGRGGYNDY